MASIPSTAAGIWGLDSVPFLACTTIWSLSPAWAGKLALTMSWAWLESVAGNEKLFAYDEPTAWEIVADEHEGEQPGGHDDATMTKTPAGEGGHYFLQIGSACVCVLFMWIGW